MAKEVCNNEVTDVFYSKVVTCHITGSTLRLWFDENDTFITSEAVVVEEDPFAGGVC